MNQFSGTVNAFNDGGPEAYNTSFNRKNEVQEYYSRASPQLEGPTPKLKLPFHRLYS